MPARKLPPGVYASGKDTWKYLIDLPPTYSTVVQPDGTRRTVKQRRQESRGGFPSPREAAAARQRRQAEIEQQINVNPSRDTLTTYLRAWLERKRALRDSTRHMYQQHIERRVASYGLGSLVLGKLTPALIAHWHAELLAARYSTSTIHGAHAVLAQALDEALRWGNLPRNPARLVTPPQPAASPARVWTLEQLVAFLDSAERSSDCNAAFFRLAVMLGLRPGELRGLRWADVDLERGTLSIERTATLDAAGHNVLGDAPKTKAGRRLLRLPPSCLAALKRHRRTQTEWRLRIGGRWHDHGLVFAAPDGSLLHAATVRDRAQRLMRQAGVPPLRLHDLRHTAATFAISSGEHPKTTQARLGHAHISETLDRYGHLIEAVDTEAAARLDTALETFRRAGEQQRESS